MRPPTIRWVQVPLEAQARADWETRAPRVGQGVAERPPSPTQAQGQRSWSPAAGAEPGGATAQPGLPSAALCLASAPRRATPSWEDPVAMAVLRVAQTEVPAKRAALLAATGVGEPRRVGAQAAAGLAAQRAAAAGPTGVAELAEPGEAIAGTAREVAAVAEVAFTAGAAVGPAASSLPRPAAAAAAVAVRTMPTPPTRRTWAVSRAPTSPPLLPK